MAKRMFSEYLFADYSGGGENHQPQRNISLFSLLPSRDPQKLIPSTKSTKNFSRDSLAEFVLDRLTLATQRGTRIVFGFDHQFAWPIRLRKHARIESLSWRDTIRILVDGSTREGLPPLDIPKRYCQAFNTFSGESSFWTPLRGVAQRYRITNQRPNDPKPERFRLTELARPIQGNSRPKPADTVGGTGEGIVGGQTICGLRQLAKMIDRTDIAWWPFDGLDILSPPYEGKHIGIEIYPSAVRTGSQQSDDHDAMQTCLAVSEADKSGFLLELMQLRVPDLFQDQVLNEGWIVGMDASEMSAIQSLQTSC